MLPHTHMDILAAGRFLAKLDQYDGQYTAFESDLGPLPTSEKTSCDFLNRLLHQLRHKARWHVSYGLQL